MYIQWFVKGICSVDASGNSSFDWNAAQDLIRTGQGITSNWWRNSPGGTIQPQEVDAVLTDVNLYRHLHDYQNFGPNTPFISVTAGSVERDSLLAQNSVYSAIDTALQFATDDGRHAEALYFGWLPVSLNPAVQIQAVAEAVRDLNVYHRWSPFQLEGEITAKIHIPANQIERVEWWDPLTGLTHCSDHVTNPSFAPPTPILNVRELF
jgi:hypothetical protein